MATGTAPPGSGTHSADSQPVGRPAGGGTQTHDQYIEQQLRRTRGYVKSVELCTALTTMLVGALAYLFLVVLIDHWVVSGGLSALGRVFFLFVFVVGSAAYGVVRLVPLLFRRINPLYAAHTLELNRPTLKNGLINFLLLRREKSHMPRIVYRAVERQAASGLAHVAVESAVDRTRLIRVGYVLMAVVAVCCLYKLVSPKDPLPSIGRIIVPWADLKAPTRVAIDRIQVEVADDPHDFDRHVTARIDGGSATAYQGQHLRISAVVNGGGYRGPVELVYSTADGQVIDQRVQLARPGGSFRHQLIFSGGPQGLQQDIAYRLAAGDAATDRFRINVLIAPSIVVDRVEYDYPDYTGLADRVDEQLADISAYEGTRVTVHAHANQLIESAYVDIDSDQRRDLTMQVDGQDAWAEMTLEHKGDESIVESRTYQVLFRSVEGRANPNPIRSRLEIIPDRTPEVRIPLPGRDGVDVPVNGRLDIEVMARDHDFALRSVVLRGETRTGKRVLEEDLLAGENPKDLDTVYRFAPAKLGLKEGEEVVYWAEAKDNKLPTANRAQTIKYVLRIGPSRGQPEEPDRSPQGDRQADPRQPKESRDGADPRRPEQPPPPEDSDNEQPQDKAPDRQDDRTSSAAGENQNRQSGTDAGQQRPDPSDRQGDQDADAEDKTAGQREDGTDAQSRETAAGDQPQSTDDRESTDDRQRPVDPEEQPSEAFKRLQDYFEEQDKDSQGSQGEGQQPEKESDPSERNQQSSTGDEPSATQQAPSRDGAQPNQPKEQPRESGQREPHKPGSEPQEQPARGDNADEQQADQRPQDNEQQRPGDNAEQRPDPQQESSTDESKESPKDEREQSASQSGESESGEQGGSQSGANSGDSAAEEKQSGQGGTGTGRAGKQPPGDNQAKQGSPGAAQQEGQAEGEGKPSGAKSGEPQPKAADAERGTGDAERQTGERRSPDKADQSQKSQRPGPGDGARSGGAAGKQQPKSSTPRQSEDAPEGGDPNHVKGPSGAGRSPTESNPSPSSQETNQPRDKSQENSDDNSREGTSDSPSSPSTSRKESDSKGEQRGDRSGGGGQGGGQQGNRPGTGGAGTNTAADQGGSKSEQSGDGEASPKAGNRGKAESQTGQSGRESGPGSARREGGDQSGQGGSPTGGDDDTTQPPSAYNQPPSDDRQQANSRNSGRAGQGGGGGLGGGGGNVGDPPPAAPPQGDVRSEPGGDDPNLEYARKATDLVLSRLKDQLDKDRPDQELLDALGWDRGDLERFYRFWDESRQEAAGNDRQARNEFDSTLKSLGLRPRATTVESDPNRADSLRNLREAHRSSPPSEYAEQFEAFKRGSARRPSRP